MFIFLGFYFSVFSSLSPTPRQILGCDNYILVIQNKLRIELDYIFFIALAIVLGALHLSWFLLLYLCSFVSYVPIETNLSMGFRRTNNCNPLSSIFLLLSCFLLGLLLCENPECLFIQHHTKIISSIGTLTNLALNSHKVLSQFCFHFSVIFIFSESVSPATCFLCILVFLIWCHTCTKTIPDWLLFILILLANDIELNPGPQFQNNFFSFMNWNLNSLAKGDFERVSLIEAHNSIFDYDLISICETSLKDSIGIPDPLLNGYNFIPSNHPDDVSHGGVGLFYKTSLPVIHRNDLSFNESIVIELKFGRKNIFFTVLYRSPSHKHGSPEFDVFLTNFRNLYSKIEAENPYATFFTGDFNGHSQFWWPDGDTNAEGRVIEDLLTSLNLTQIISEPTNFQPGKRPSCIDLIVTDQPNFVLESGTRPSLDPTCHHQIIHCKVNFRIPPPPPVDRKIWHYDKANTAAIRRSMLNFPWNQQLNLNSDVNCQVKIFTETLLNIMSNFIPNEIKRMVPRDPPWITKSLKTMLKRKNRLYKNYKRHGYRDEDKARLEAFREECKKAVENSKLSYVSNLGNKVNDPSTSQKCYWKIVNRVMNKCRAPKIPPLLVRNTFILDCAKKAKLFNDFFSRQCKLIINDSALPPPVFHTDKRIDNVFILDDEIISLIRHLNPNKAMGPDGISGQMLLLCDHSVVLPLKIIFRSIIETSVYPDMWKLANVTPIYKKENKQLVKNYRPISLLPICGKMFEKIIFNSLYNYLNGNGLLTKNQSGFRPGDSTSNQLLFLVNVIHEAFDNPKCLEVRAVFLDISKAFDKVWHEGLIFKLKLNGISGNLLKFFESYLHNRKQRVILNGSYSEYLPIESGVPQGSVLGPLLFLIYINDLEINIKSNVKFFADDTMLYSIVNDPVQTGSDLNHDLDVIHQWAYQWKMEFNPDPTKQANEVLFSCKRTPQNHPHLFFNGVQVTQVNEQKHLGLILENNLSFEKHLDGKMRKAKKNIGILKHLSKYLPLKTLDQMYKALVRCHLDYCDMIYHIPPTLNERGLTLHTLMEIVEKIQYQAALAITGAWQGTCRLKLYEELGWETLSDRRLSKRVLQIHKIIDGKTPPYLKDELPPNRLPFLLTVFREIKCRTDRHQNSFFPDAISSWNNIITHFEHFPTYDGLKKHLLSFFRPKSKPIFGLHDPEGLRYLFQLRLGLSHLRSHKKDHKFTDTPSNICLCKQGAEDTYHFILLCSFYTNHRAVLVSTVSDILQKNGVARSGNELQLYLYGHPSINDSNNRKILLSTIKYINETNRFSKS